MCVHCGGEISAPPSATETERLLWATRHPDPDVGIMAAKRLGTQGDPAAIPALRGLVEDALDPYVAAEALRSLLILSSDTAEKALLQRLQSSGPVLLRKVAITPR